MSMGANVAVSNFCKIKFILKAFTAVLTYYIHTQNILHLQVLDL